MKKLLILLLPVTLLLSFQNYRKDLSHGKKLFTANCSICHHPTRPIVGPPLQYIRKDLDTNWIFAFIKNHDSFAKSGDVRAHTLIRYGIKPMLTRHTTTLAITT